MPSTVVSRQDIIFRMSNSGDNTRTGARIRVCSEMRQLYVAPTLIAARARICDPYLTARSFVMLMRRVRPVWRCLVYLLLLLDCI